MISYLIKAFSFFVKEIHDVRRQPRLLISLVGGPLVVLAVFGATFRSANPFVDAVLVWPENGIPGVSREQAANFVANNFHLVEVTSDEVKAMSMLEDGQVDVVQIIPDTGFPLSESDARPEIRVFSRTVNPQVEAWIRSISYAEANYINQQLLIQEANLAKDSAAQKYEELAEVQQEFQQVSLNLDSLDAGQIGASVSTLRALLAELTRLLPPEGLAQANLSPELRTAYRDIGRLSDDLDELEQAVRQGELAAQADRLGSTLDEIENLRVTLKVFIGVPAEKIVTPVKDTYTNLRGSPYSLVVFYAPAVLALLVQQLAITLAGLGLVRERQMGAFEMFRVSPLRLSQILTGKSLAYILYVTVSGLILTLLLLLLKVPLPALPAQFFAMLVLLGVAAVGVGLLISSLSSTDSQAIQLSMIVLLLSIFFTGFFLDVSGFAWPAWIVTLLIPMSYALYGFQALMLEGRSPEPFVWIGLVVVALISYGLTALVMRRQYRKVMN